MSHRTRHCAVCASSTQVTDRAYRAPHRATLLTAVAVALPAHDLPIARGSGGSECAHALPHHPLPAPQAPRRRTSDRRSHGRAARWRPPLAPTAACPSRTPTAATSSRSPRPLRLTAALCPLPCPLLQCYGCVAARERLRLRSLAKFGVLPPLYLEPAACTRHSQRGIAKVRGIQGTRAGNRGCTARPTVDSETRPARWPQCRPSRSRRSRCRW
jgi:hypothetical protein